MSLLPNRRTVHSIHREALTSGPRADRSPYRPPFRLVPRLVLFAALTIIFHGFATFAVSQIVRSHPGLMTDNPAVGALLCGEGTTLRLDFSPPGPGRRRGLANWIDCLDGDGTPIRDAGTVAALLSGLVLTLPFAMVMFGVILRMNHGPHGRGAVLVETPPEPVDRVTRLVLSVIVLLVAGVISGSVAAYVTQYQPAVLRHPVAARLACGADLSPQIVFPHTRGRRLGCFDGAGSEHPDASRHAMLRLLAPLYGLIVIPGIWLVFRIRTIRRTR